MPSNKIQIGIYILLVSFTELNLFERTRDSIQTIISAGNRPSGVRARVANCRLSTLCYFIHIYENIKCFGGSRVFFAAARVQRYEFSTRARLRVWELFMQRKLIGGYSHLPVWRFFSGARWGKNIIHRKFLMWKLRCGKVDFTKINAINIIILIFIQFSYV